MKKNNKIIQTSLLIIGLILIISTYFLYPKILENKSLKTELNEKTKTQKSLIEKDEINSFNNVEYKGFYDLDKSFIVKSEKAFIKEQKPNIVNMKNMKVVLYLNDGRVVTITSDAGIYDKVTYDCFFHKNVKATDGETVILAENLDLIATEDMAKIYNNVDLTNEDGMLQADKVTYNFKTKYYKISIFNNEKVKIKLIE